MPGRSSREDKNEGKMDRAKGRVKEAGGGPVITFQPEGGLDAAVEDLRGKGVHFPAEIS